MVTTWLRACSGVPVGEGLAVCPLVALSGEHGEALGLVFDSVRGRWLPVEI